MSISVEAAAAHDSLSNDQELIHTYEVDLSSLVYHSTPLLGAPMAIFYLSDSSLSSCLC